MTSNSKELIEQLRYHQAEVARLSQLIAGDPCQGVIFEPGEDGYLKARATQSVDEGGR